MIDDFWLEVDDELEEMWQMPPTFEEVHEEIERRFKIAKEEELKRFYGK